MSTFKEIAGRNIRSYTTNPDNPLEGQMWYNQTDFALKGLVASGAWSSAASSTNGGSARIGFGIQTAGIAAGGSTAPGNQTTVEEYNGSGWSTETALPVSRQDGGGAGTTTAGLVWCGEGPAKLNTTQEYDGSSWTTTGNYPITARGVRGSGTQTAAISDGGDTSAPAASNVSAEYNGSTWTAGNNLPGNRIAAATSGTQTAALATTGKDNTPNPSVSNLNTSYDGTSWTAETVYPLSLRQAVSTGTSSAANLVAGGVGATPFGDAVTAANVWNGSSWTAVGDLGTKSTHGNGAGSSTASYINSGAQDYPSYPGVTQEYNFGTTVITPGSWASGGNLNTSRAGLTGFGTQTAAIAANGDTWPPATGRYTAGCEEYNGATWTGVSPTNTSTTMAGSSKLSPASAGSVFGGEPVSARHEYWDGSTWSEQTDMNTPGYAVAGAGTQTSSLAMAGASRPTSTESWDGSSWTSESAVPFSTVNTPGAGSQTAAIIFGGNGPSGLNTTAEYNSGTWTAGGNLISPKTNQGGAGTQTAALSFIGSFPTTASAVTTTEGYDGTAWSTRPSAATARRTLGSAGTSTAALGFGGYTPGSGKTAATEEFTGETTAVNIKTFTTS